MSAIEADRSSAELAIVTSDRAARGATIKRRRMGHGIRSVREFSEKTGLSRDAITGAEKGAVTTTEATYERLETWLDDYDRTTQLDTREPADVPSPREGNGPGDLPQDIIEVVVEGPSTKFKVRFRGHADQADSLREQAEKIIDGISFDE